MIFPLSFGVLFYGHCRALGSVVVTGLVCQGSQKDSTGCLCKVDVGGGNGSCGISNSRWRSLVKKCFCCQFGLHCRGNSRHCSLWLVLSWDGKGVNRDTMGVFIVSGWHDQWYQ